jgi:hypothetical protein
VRTAWVILGVLMLAGCAAQPTPAPTVTSQSVATRWGTAQLLTEFPAIEAPALTGQRDALTAAAFTPVNLDAALTLYRDGQAVPTRVVARNPYALGLYPAARDGGYFVVWLQYTGGQASQLYVASLNADGTSTLGAVRVAEMPVVRYSAIPMPDGTLWLAWSATPIPESSVFISRIDGLGRARLPERITHNADYPALLRADGRTWLYWLSADHGALQRAELPENAGLGPIQALTGIGTPALNRGDRVAGFSVGADTANAYAFWDVERADGTRQAWWAAGSFTSVDGWAAPRPLTLAVDAASSPQAGFNHGVLQGADVGADLWVTSALPVAGQSDVLPVAATWDDAIGIVYFSGGRPLAIQAVMDDAPPLIAAPRAAYNRARDLALAWWDAGSPQTARLFIVYSRPPANRP